MSEVERLSISLMVMFISCSVNCVFRSFAHFSVVLPSIFNSALYVRVISPESVSYVATIFPQFHLPFDFIYCCLLFYKFKEVFCIV